MLDIFALIVLLVLCAAAVAVWVIVGMLPGRIARERNHPQAEAISVCGWFGVLTMGLLCPIAFIWAYTNASDTTKTPDTNPNFQ
ncbi:Inner membrane protein YiaW [Planctomycetes bacterium CA13]|uniref:Inner membrane protein YiaW n=1 Tax=Novipirellula herctigrandis TaxID=2527986 RepID=A0A5C5Z493_9BACT|nr:Inner membrane protein YiaW [Planctomycetes bacterium CA13]